MAIKINPAPLHMAQAVLVGISAIMSLCILSTSAHTLAVYNKQHTFNPWWLYLWPQHFDVSGTKWLLGSSVSVFVLSSIFLAFNLIPRLSMANKPTPRALLSLATLVPSVLLSLVTIVYAHILNNNSPDRDTIQTWTCKYKNGHALEQDVQLPSDMGNGNFGALCRESKFALWGSLVVLLILGVGVGLTFVSWAADKWAARAEKKEKDVGSMQG